MTATGIGASVKRVEDFRFLTGRGRYTDDIVLPGQAHVWIVRSPHAHARILSIGIAKAAAAPGVIAVYTGADMEAAGVGGLPCGWQVHNKDGSPMAEPPHPPLAQGKGLPDGITTSTTDNGGGDVPSVLLDTIAIDKGNVDLVIKDGFATADEICTGPYKKACTAAGIS